MSFRNGRIPMSKRWGVLVLALFLVGCATLPDEYRDPKDPFESYNRAMTRFNDKFDKYVAKPIARGYRAITPAPVDKGITNFFNNFYDVSSAINNLLQFKLVDAVSDVGRVVFNTTLGVFGLVDVASSMDFPSHKEDFGQTLGYWGIPTGPYLVLPILGPSDVRDAFGLVGDAAANPINYLKDNNVQTGLVLLRGIDQRADLLSATKVLEEAALDPYVFTRDAYLQKRLNDVYDGAPPPEDDFFEDEEEPLEGDGEDSADEAPSRSGPE